MSSSLSRRDILQRVCRHACVMTSVFVGECKQQHRARQHCGRVTGEDLQTYVWHLWIKCEIWKRTCISWPNHLSEHSALIKHYTGGCSLDAGVKENNLRVKKNFIQVTSGFMNMPLIFCQLWKIERGMAKQVLWITIDYSILTTTEDRMAVCVCQGPHMH